MPRNLRRKKAIAELSDEDEEEAEDVEVEDEAQEGDDDAEDEDSVLAPREVGGVGRRRGEDPRKGGRNNNHKAPTSSSSSSGSFSQQQGGMFTSQVPEATQAIHDVKDSDLRNFLNLPKDKQEKAVRDLFRVVLFRGHQMESIERSKCVKEAGLSSHRITSAAFKEVEAHLQNLFGYGLRRVPPFLERMKGLPANVKDKYYVINMVEDETGEHSQALHGVHDECVVEKALLILVLALAYCKGSPKHDGSRWIHDKDLYYLLHAFDDNIPSEPPTTGGRNGPKKRPNAALSLSAPSQRFGGSSGVSQTPDVDALLDKFVRREHLVRAKATEDQVLADPKVEPESCYYAMGPRSALEVGRKQVVYFCAEVLGEQPDAAMLKEIEDDDRSEDGHGAAMVEAMED